MANHRYGSRCPQSPTNYADLCHRSFNLFTYWTCLNALPHLPFPFFSILFLITFVSQDYITQQSKIARITLNKGID